MIEPKIDDLLASVDSKYSLVILAAKRAHGRDDNVVGVDETAGGTPAALNLHNRRRGSSHRVSE